MEEKKTRVSMLKEKLQEADDEINELQIKLDKEIEQQTMNNNPDTIIITTCVYQMNARINYKDLKKKLIKCHTNIKLLVK